MQSWEKLNLAKYKIMINNTRVAMLAQKYLFVCFALQEGECRVSTRFFIFFCHILSKSEFL